MAKDVYKIPETLAKTAGDMEVSLKTQDGIGVNPMPLYVLGMWFLAVVLAAYIVTQTFISQAGIFVIILFLILYICMAVLILRRDKTGAPQISLVIAMFGYLPKKMRRVITRNASPASEFEKIAGIADIDDATGMITFFDNTYGYMYRVVGSGSILLFDADRVAILNRVDSFYRKMKTDYELIFITTKEAQRVYRQAGALMRKYKALDVHDSDLTAIANMEYKCLTEFVGKQHRSIHQYLIIKADNKEALLVGKNMLQSEVENSTLVFKQCAALYGDDILETLRSVYAGNRG